MKRLSLCLLVLGILLSGLSGRADASLPYDPVEPGAIPSEQPLLSLTGPFCLLDEPGHTVVRWFGEKGEYRLIFEWEGSCYAAAATESVLDGEYGYTVKLPLEEFRYRITDGSSATDWYSCRERTGSDGIRFTFLGDPQIIDSGDADAFRDGMTYFQDSDFVLLGGDLVNNPQELWQYEVCGDAWGESGLSAAAVRGNHDDSRLFRFYFGMEQPPTEDGDYFFRVGDVLFLCFDSNNPEMGNRRAFVEEALGKTEWDWVIACMHHSIYPPISRLDYDADTRFETFVRLFSEYDIDLVLSGHDHYYARSYLMGGDWQLPTPERSVEKSTGQTLYLTAGSCSGSKYYTPKKELPRYVHASGKPKTVSVIQVEIQENTLEIKAVYPQTGEVFDRFTLTREQKHQPGARQQAGSSPFLIPAIRDYLMSCRLPEGAIGVYPAQEGVNWVNPYFADYAALALLRCGEYDAVREYILWHINRLNPSENDINGMSYTIYDYHITIQDGVQTRQTSTGDYDSIDSYASSFLVLLNEYRKATNDTALICEKDGFVGGVIQLLTRLFDDGLTVARPDHPMYYLMDNCETFLALEAAAELIDVVVAEKRPDSRSWPKLKQTCLQQRQQLLERLDGLWEEAAEAYPYAVSPQGEASLPGKALYPDGVCQLCPVLFGLLSPESSRARSCYQRFCEAWSWETLEPKRTGETDQLWAMIACAAAEMGDTARVEEYMKNFMAYASSEKGSAMGAQEAAWTILAVTGGIS